MLPGPVVLEVENLHKTFRLPVKGVGLRGALRALVRPEFSEKVAVDQLSFSVARGEMVGYIGVNGAGKSTTIKMLTGVLAPSSGSVRVLGRDPHRQRVQNARDIGVVFGQRTQLWWDIALIESLNLIARMYEVPPARFKALLEEFAATLELSELLSKPVRAMSLGQKMRAELAATLIHEPQVVYLDEPTIGLDIIAKHNIREFIKKQNVQRQTTVLLTTHDLGDIEELCARVIIIDAGRKIYDGPLETIKRRFGTHRTIRFELAPEQSLSGFHAPPSSELIQHSGQSLTLRFDRERTSASSVAMSVMNALEVLDFSIQEPDLGAIITQIYGGALERPSSEVIG